MLVTEAGDAGGQVSTPLLTVKLVQPRPSPHLLLRPELVERLADGAPRVYLISAPAGWGKTSLLSAWLSERDGQHTAFLRLEGSDDAAPLFWLYVIAALRKVLPGLVDGADDALRSPDVDPMQEVVPSLLNELAESGQPLLLVLDDYHVISEPAIQSSVGYLIDHLPPGVQLAISTRTDPHLPLGRLRASGDLMEVRAHDLAFSSRETSELLRSRFAVDLDDDDVDLLRRRTEGWPAAVHLAGLSLREAEEATEFVGRFAGDDRNIADFLIAEALGTVSDRDREFLLRTSVLGQMTGPLCEVIAGVSDGAEILDRMDRSGLFLIPLDNQRRWYRYHHLFADWLRHELRKTDPTLIPTLHLAAAEWYAQTDALEPAVDHAIDAGDNLLAARLIDRYLIRDWTGANWSLVWRWFQVLPDDAIIANPMTSVARFNVALSRGDFASSSKWLEAAETALGGVPVELLPTIEGAVALHRAFGELVAGGDADYARTALLAIADQERSRDSILFAQAIAAAGMAAFWTTGPLDAVPPLHEGVLARSRQSVRDGGATALLALAYAEVGDWAAAEETANKALALPEPAEWNGYPDRMAAHFALGKVHLARGERDEAISCISTGLGMARQWVEPIFVAYGCLALAECRTDYAEKRALVREARSLVDGPGGRGRIVDLVAAAERKLALRRPQQETAGTVHVDPLTDRELEVLRMLRGELSLREIANELYISHNTIKSYTKSIYRKLGVTSRAAALEAADDLDLG